MKHTILALALASACAAPVASQVTFDFKGGSLDEYVGTLREAIEAQRELYTDLTTAGVDFPNIAVLGPVERVLVPKLSFTDADPEAAVQVLEVFEQPDSRVRIDVKRIAHPSGGVTRGVIAVCVRVAEERRGPGPGASEPVVEVFSIGSLIEVPAGFGDAPNAASLQVPVEEILVSIDTGLKLIDSTGAHKLKYHAESGLLFVRGTVDHVALARKSLGELMDAVSRRRDDARFAREGQKQQARIELQELRAQVALQLQQIAELKASLAEMKQRSGGDKR